MKLRNGNNSRWRRHLDGSDDECFPTDQRDDEVVGYDSDSCSISEDVFDAEQADAARYETDETNLTDADDGNPEGAAVLLGGNAHLPEYYIRALEAFDESSFDA
jgi:hypothetical protein